MKTKPTGYSIMFRLNNQRAKQGKPTIYLRLTVNNRRVELSTNQMMAFECWDQKNQCANPTTEENREINRQLTNIKASIDKHYQRLVALDLNVTAELLKNEYMVLKSVTRP